MKHTLLIVYLIILINMKLNNAQDFCSSMPCRSPAECENQSNKYVCHCVNGVKGQNCQRRMIPGDNPCLSSPCWNGGTCVNLQNDWACDCLPGYSGKNCRVIEATPCTTNNPCLNGANCQVISSNGVLQPVCLCVGDWTGINCESSIPFCERPNPCFNGGTCVNNACKCNRNFTGAQCETFTEQRSLEKQVKVYNKGFFMAKMRLTYEEQNGFSKYLVEKSSSMFLGSEHTFTIPTSTNYDSLNGVRLMVNIVLGPSLLNERILDSPECFHLWGIFFAPSWARVPCW